jgi:hypothetical protein
MYLNPFSIRAMRYKFECVLYHTKKLYNMETVVWRLKNCVGKELDSSDNFKIWHNCEKIERWLILNSNEHCSRQSLSACLGVALRCIRYLWINPFLHFILIIRINYFNIYRKGSIVYSVQIHVLRNKKKVEKYNTSTPKLVKNIYSLSVSVLSNLGILIQNLSLMNVWQPFVWPLLCPRRMAYSFIIIVTLSVLCGCRNKR